MNLQTDTLLLQDFTPYDQSLKWEIQDRYYNGRGSDAWLSAEVPYRITSNSVAAYQNAELVYAEVALLEKKGILGKKDNINILEMASGLGMFAVNFIKAFRGFDIKQKANRSSRLKYFFTDYSEVNLKEASKNSHLKKLNSSGFLEFCVLNAKTPNIMKSLSTRKTLPPPPLVTVISNYLHCCLPAKILKKRDGIFYEKFIKLFLKKTEANANLTSVDSVLAQLSGITENLIEEVSWKKIHTSSFINPLHRKVVEEGVNKFPVATIIYPYTSFISIEATIPCLINGGGIIIISDKGYSDSKPMQGEHSYQPSIHGNSFAHSLNFPLLELLANKLGCAPVRTNNPLYSIQTLLIENRKKSVHQQLFEKLFMKKNDNIDANDLYRGGRSMADQEEYLVAIRLFERSRQLKSKDAYLFYHLGRAYYEYELYENAIEVLKEGKSLDYFQEYDFDFRIGYTYYIKCSYKKAISAYVRSLKWERTAAKLYNLGLCYKYLKNANKAKLLFNEALTLDPDYQKAKDAIKKI